MPLKERASLYERMRRAPVVRRVLGVSFVQRALSPAQGDRAIHRFIRYSMVSGVSIFISELTILICTWLFGLSGIVSNTIGTVAATPASYELNRKWAWGKSGKGHLWKEAVPFWSLTLVGWLASTGTVAIADNVAKSDNLTGLVRGLVIVGASLFAWGVVWIAKFVIFNKVIFVTRSVSGDDDEGLDGEGFAGTPNSSTGGGAPLRHQQDTSVVESPSGVGG